VALFDLRLVCAERDQQWIVIGIDVDRDSEQFQYFECWTSRTGDVSFNDRQRLVAAAVKAIGDRPVCDIQPLADSSEAIFVPLESHPTGPVLSSTIAAALIDLAAINRGSLEPPVIQTIERFDRPGTAAPACSHRLAFSAQPRRVERLTMTRLGPVGVTPVG
jgi:hypothetical protein